MDGLDQYLDQFVPRNPKVDSILDRMRDSVITQESGGDPKVKNARTSATGLFQVMPANIPSWTKSHYGKSLTPEQFASDVNAQEKVFRGEMGKYVNKALQKAKGDEDLATRMAAAAWYGGEGAMHRYDDPTKFRPNEPSFQEYTTSILGRIKKGQIKSQGLDKYLDQFTPQSNEGLDSYLDQFVDVAPQMPAQSPIPETPDTLQAQMASAKDPNSPRAAVLTTSPEQNALFGNGGWMPAQTKDGMLWVDPAKAKKLKLRTPKDLQLFVDNNPDAMTRLIGKVDNVADTSQGMAVQTLDPATGTELTSSIVTSPESAQQQAAIDQASFPGSVSTELPAEDVVQKRLADYEAIQNIQPIMDRFPGSGRAVGTPLAPKQAQKRPTARGGVDVSVGELTPEFDGSRAQEVQSAWTGAKKDVADDDVLQGYDTFKINLKGVPPEQKSAVAHQQAVAAAARKYGVSRDKVQAYLAAKPMPAESVAPDADVVNMEYGRGALAEFFGRDAIVGKYRETQREMLYPLYEKYRDAPKNLDKIPAFENPIEGQYGVLKEQTEREASEALRAPRTGPVEFTSTADWQAAFNRLLDPEFWKSGSAVISQEERNRAVNQVADDMIRTAGDAQTAQRIQAEYEQMSGLEKGVRHAGDFAKTIARFPASFAKTVAWAEDSIGYLREQGIVLPTATPTDLFNAVDWVWSKTLGIEPKGAKQGEVPMLLAKAIEKGLPDDPKTANTLMGKISRGLGSAVPFMIGAVASGGSTAVVTLMGIGAQSGEMYGQAQDAGLTREKTLLAGLAGVPLGATEALGLKWAKLGQLINGSSKGVFVRSFTNWLKETGKEATEEALQEYFQSAAGKLTITALKDNGLTRRQVADAMGDAMGDAGIGGLVGAIFGGGVPIVTGNVKMSGKPAIPEAEVQAQTISEPSQAQKTEPDKPAVQTEAPVISERVSTPKGEGVVIEDRGNKVLVDFDNGSRAEVRKNQVEPVADLLSNKEVQQQQEIAPVETPKADLQSNEIPDELLTEDEIKAKSQNAPTSAPRLPARRMVIEPKDGGPAIYPESRKATANAETALKSVIARTPEPIRDAPSDAFSRRLWLRTQDPSIAELDHEIRMKGKIPSTVEGSALRNLIIEKFRLIQDYSGLGDRGMAPTSPWKSVQQDVARNYMRSDRPDITEPHALQTWRNLDDWYKKIKIDDTSPSVLNLLDHKYWTQSYNPSALELESPLKKARDAESTALLPKLQNEGTAKILSNLKGGKVADNGDFEINEHESEQIRRLLAEKHFQETGTEIDEKSFDAITWSAETVRDLVELGRDLVTDFKRGGYTDAELKGYNTLLDNLEDSINKAKDYAVAFVFDDALPEEKVHQEDLRAGRTDAEALDTLKSNPLWKGSEKFNRDYSTVSDADRASEIAAKLLTGQEKAYGFDSIEDFETHKTAFLNDWADGILRKNDVKTDADFEAFAKKFTRIGQYAALKTDQQRAETKTGREPGADRVSEKEVRGDEEKGFTPAGKEKVSKTPSTLRKNDIPVQDRSYISVTNPDQQEFADNQLNKGLDKATEWFDEQIADNNLNNGATTVVGLNLLNQLGKKGMIKEMNEVADKLVPFITEAAQSVQAVATVSMFNPDNAGTYAAKVAKQHGTELTDKGFKKAEELAKNLNETAQVDAFADRALADAENHLIDVREDIEVSIEAGRIARGGADVSLDLESANKMISDLRKKIEQLQNRKPKKSANKNIAELEAKEDKILAAIKAKYGSKEDAPLKSVSFSDNDPDLVDWATLTLNRHLKSGDMSVGTFYNELNKLTNGQLTEEQIGDIHAEAVSKIKVARTIGPDKRLAQQLRNEHYRASEAHINRYDIQIKQMLDEQAKRLREQAKDAEKSEKETEQVRAKKNITRLKAEIAAKQSEIAEFKAFEKEEIKQAQKEVREMVKEMNKAQRSIKAQDKFVSAIIDEGIKGGFSDEAIFFALARKSKPKVEDAMAEFKKEYGDVDKKTQRQIMADAENIFQRAKKAVSDNVLQAKNEFNLTEEDIERIKEEKRFNQSAARKIKLEADRFYSGLSQTTRQVIADTAVNFRRANLLTGVKTHLRNMAGNTAFGVSEEISRIPSSIADIGASLLTGQRTVQGVSPTAIINGFNNIIRQDETFKNLDKDSGKTAALNILMYGDTLDNLEKQQHQQSLLATKSPREGKEKKFEFFGKERSISTDPAKWMDNYINGVFRTLGAEDALFKTYAFRRALEEEAYTQALSEKRVDKSVNVKERQKELIKNPTFVMQKIADDYATFATFQNDNAVSTLFTKFKKLHPGIKAVAEIVVPYDRTPTNIVLRVLEHAPVIGTGIAVKKALDMRKAPDKKFKNEYAEAVRDDLWDGDFEALAPTVQRQLIEEGIAKVWSRQRQREFAKTFGRQSWGTALFGTGYLLASLGLLTGSMAPDDDDKEETKEFFARRKKGVENKSLRIPGVGRFVLTDDPAMKIMAAGATLYEQSRMSKSSGLKAAWDGMKETTGDMLTEQPLLSNMGQLYRVFSKGKVGEYLGSTVSGFFPASAMVGDIAEISDEKSRTVSGFKDKDERKTMEGELTFQVRGFKNSAIRRIPLLRTLADESKDAFPKGDVLRRAVRAIDLFNTRPDIEYDVNDQKDKSTADKVRSGDMSVSDAKTELENQYRDGKITRKTYKTRIKDLENDTFEKALKEMNAAKDDDFTKIEAFLKEVPDSRMEDARKILRQKRANKLKDNSPKAREDARKLQELMAKYLRFAGQ